MNKAILAVLILIAIAHAMDWYLDRKEPSAGYTNEQVTGLDDLVARVSMGKKQKQADALAKLWHITQADLSSEVDIYGERHAH